MKLFNNIYLIYGKSGTGKSALVERLKVNNPNVQILQSYTTRVPRDENETGHTFVTPKEYSALKDVVAETSYDNHNYCCTLEQLKNADVYIIDEDGIVSLKEYFFDHTYDVNIDTNDAEQQKCIDDLKALRDKIRIIYVYSDPNERQARLIRRDGLVNGMNRYRYDEEFFHLEKDGFATKDWNDDWTIYNDDFDTAYHEFAQAILSMEQDDIQNINTFLHKGKKYYISHPYSGDEANKEEVERIVKALQAIEPDAVFISPIHTFSYMYDFFSSYYESIQLPLRLLDVCDEMLVFGDYQSSYGCNLEIDYCQRYGIAYHIIGNMGLSKERKAQVSKDYTSNQHYLDVGNPQMESGENEINEQAQNMLLHDLT